MHHCGITDVRLLQFGSEKNAWLPRASGQMERYLPPWTLCCQPTNLPQWCSSTPGEILRCSCDTTDTFRMKQTHSAETGGGHRLICTLPNLYHDERGLATCGTNYKTLLCRWSPGRLTGSDVNSTQAVLIDRLNKLQAENLTVIAGVLSSSE